MLKAFVAKIMLGYLNNTFSIYPGGHSHEEHLRMKAHIALNAIPTLTIGSAGELEHPNDAVKEILSLAI